MALVAFEQEPTAPEGMGTFHFDDGRTLFAHDPELAKTVPHPAELDQGIAAAAMRGPDMRTAQNPFRTTDQRLDAGGAAPGGSDEQLAAMNFKAPTGPPAGAPQAQPPGPVGGGPQQEAPPDLMKSVVSSVNAPVHVGATRGGVIPKSQSTTVESEGPQYDPEHVATRQAANNDLMIARRNEAATLAQRSQAESLAMQAKLPELQKQAAQAQQEQADQHNAYKAERADLEKMIQDSQTAQKSFNANRWFESRGAIGQIGAVLAQAMGAYAATLGHGENWAQKLINGYIDQDIAEQKEQIAAHKGNVDNALNRLKLRYGDMGQAESALKLAMGKVADTQALAYAKSTGAKDIEDTWGKQVAQNTVDRVKEEQAFEAASKGKVKTTTNATVVAPSAGGYRPPTDDEKLKRINVLKGTAGVSEAVSDAEIKAQKAAGGGEQAEKDAPRVIEGLDGKQSLARTEKEGIDIRGKFALHQKASASLGELKNAAGIWNTLSPDQRAAFKTHFEVAASTVNSGLGQNSMKDDDFRRWNSYLSQGALGVNKALEEVQKIADTSYQAEVDAQRGAGVTEDYSRGKPRTAYTGKGVATPTVTPRGARELE